MSSTEDEYPPLCELSRDPTGFFQPDPIVPRSGSSMAGYAAGNVWSRLKPVNCQSAHSCCNGS
jgi:hypothetical protein